MAVECPSLPTELTCAVDALADIRACSGQLQSFVFGMLDQLDEITGELLGREMASRQSQRQADRESLQGQIDQLTVVAAQLSQLLSVQKQRGRI